MSKDFYFDRRSIRLSGYNYCQAGYYFITICIHNREMLLGQISQEKIQLNDAGKMVSEYWKKLSNKFPDIKLDEWVIMPNHIHGIIIIDPVGANHACPPMEGIRPSMESIRPKTDHCQIMCNDTTPPHMGDNTTLPHMGDNTTLPHMGDNTTLPHMGDNTTLPHMGDNTTLPHMGDNTTLPHMCNDTPLPHMGNDTTLPHMGNNTPLPHMGNNTPLPHMGDNMVSPLQQHQSIPNSYAGLGQYISWFKRMTTTNYINQVKSQHWPPFHQKLWQRNYYEHIIRNEKEYWAITKYIKDNPKNWLEDELFN
jgi:putative transposase